MMRKNLMGLLLFAGIFSVACDDAKNDKSQGKCDAKNYMSLCSSDGNKLSVCRGGEIQIIDCVKEGKICGKDGKGNDACVAQGGTPTETRECNQNTLKICKVKDGTKDCEDVDCVKEGKICGKDGKGNDACVAQGGTPTTCEKAGKFCADAKTLVVCAETEDDNGQVTLKGESIECRERIESCVSEPFARCALDCTNAKVGDWNLECNVSSNPQEDHFFYRVCLDVGADNSDPAILARFCKDGAVLDAKDACTNPGGVAAYKGQNCNGKCSDDGRKCNLHACESDVTVCQNNVAVHCLGDNTKPGYSAGKWEEDCATAGGECTQIGSSGVSACDFKCVFEDDKVAWERGRCEGNKLVKCKRPLSSGGKPLYTEEDCGATQNCDYVAIGNYYACNHK